MQRVRTNHPCYGPAQEWHIHRDQQDSYRKELEADDQKNQKKLAMMHRIPSGRRIHRDFGARAHRSMWVMVSGVSRSRPSNARSSSSLPFSSGMWATSIRNGSRIAVIGSTLCENAHTGNYSRRTSRASLSDRNPRNAACRRRPSAVHSTNRICATNSGLTHCISRISSAVTPPPQRDDFEFGRSTNGHRSACRAFSS